MNRVLLIFTFLFIIFTHNIFAQCSQDIIYKTMSGYTVSDSVVYLRDFTPSVNKHIDKEKFSWDIELQKNTRYRIFIKSQGTVKDACVKLFKLEHEDYILVASSKKDGKFTEYLDYVCLDETNAYMLVINKYKATKCVFALLTLKK